MPVYRYQKLSKYFYTEMNFTPKILSLYQYRILPYRWKRTMQYQNHQMGKLEEENRSRSKRKQYPVSRKLFFLKLHARVDSTVYLTVRRIASIVGILTSY